MANKSGELPDYLLPKKDAVHNESKLAIALWAYVRAQGRMRDRWSEGDDKVKNELWKNLHACEDYAREVLESQPLNAGEQDDEPYFGWCNVEGCENEGCSGGNVWRDTGYWTVCYKHSADYREGKPQPKMKQSAIDREASRGEDGCLPLNSIKTGKFK